MSEMAVITVNSGKLLLPACNLHSFAISSSLAGQSQGWSMAQELYHYEVHVRTSIAFMPHSSHIHKTTTAATCASGVQKQNKTKMKTTQEADNWTVFESLLISVFLNYFNYL